MTGIHPTASIAADAQIPADARVGAFSLIHSGVTLESGVVIGSHCIIGEPSVLARGPTRIGAGSLIRSHCVLYAGSTFGVGFQTGHHVTIREGCTIAQDVRIGSYSDLLGHTSIDRHTRIHSGVFVPQHTTIESFVWIFPRVVLTDDPHPPSDECSVGPTLRRFSVIGAHATVLAGVTVGRGAFVGAHSFVSRDVAPEQLVAGVPARERGGVRKLLCKHGNIEGPLFPWYPRFRRGYPPEAIAELESIFGAPIRDTTE